MNFKLSIKQDNKALRKLSFYLRKADKVIIEKNKDYIYRTSCGFKLKVKSMRMFYHIKNEKRLFLFGVAENLISEDERKYDGRKLIGSTIKLKPNTDFIDFEKLGIITEKLPSHKLFKV